jgi:hypothetical protein
MVEQEVGQVVAVGFDMEERTTVLSRRSEDHLGN